MTDLTFTTQSQILHHGIEGQKWGVQNGPPYPLDRKEAKNIKKNIKKELKKTAYKKRERAGAVIGAVVSLPAPFIGAPLGAFIAAKTIDQYSRDSYSSLKRDLKKIKEQYKNVKKYEKTTIKQVQKDENVKAKNSNEIDEWFKLEDKYVEYYKQGKKLSPNDYKSLYNSISDKSRWKSFDDFVFDTEEILIESGRTL